MKEFKPTKVQLTLAYGRPIPDIIAPDLRILFCGINPGLYSGATGRHFARPGNKFWKALHQGGFTDKQLSPFSGDELLEKRLGVTNFVNRTTARADELNPEDYSKGAAILREKIEKYKPKVLAILGVGAYRIGFNNPKAKTGLQPERIHGAFIWVLPNPSGLNAHFQSSDFAKLFRELWEFSNTLG